MNETIYRHGDCLLKQVENIPDTAKKVSGTTIAYGEVTGHHHSFIGNSVNIFEHNNQKYVQVKKESQLTHQEHDTISIGKGCYVLLMEREMNPFIQKIQQVLD